MAFQARQFKSLWFAALVALLVALGTQSLLNVLIPVRAASWFIEAPTSQNIIFISGVTNFWPLTTFIRLVSFAVGGFVGVQISGNSSVRAIALTAVVSLASAVVEDVEAPDIHSIFKLYIWIFAAPAGICFGAVMARITSRAA